MSKFYIGDDAKRRYIFSNNLRFIARNSRFKIKDIAKRADVSQTMLGHYMRGSVYPNEEVIKRLAAALEITVDDLYDETDAPCDFDRD